ncbi:MULTISPECIES: bifunctional pantoate--beta-alanine ligase/(d)CMP kinase [Okeania]|uniref:bifunctional pantoate--beta-alanine ligase/(d)CMP kinase n=1 Tax=Okeania TaxID=1458928 RepID=UPI000F549C9C|nr:MULTISPECIES: bifunctional pantoate--beta-alanine ligase/(d)CMP kinase [Okeania]NET14424.1 bifunctional pantoate--beta-alanine ligase/(d)CMP kinase [Okeania sp. SIO1H6]NES76635.1 bifunctional pantoate--beta-alanine ligase/(d)CMP kinase [Okeania sp. SIO1H4]NET20266.1 bifunctional pantoate--beta-alanine ligase/(d)CMP kinase [Okeania sp. SIO1H5]NET94485.1 bifunctional pantoate--beta-alanine ligase/(d)CMP kinase [Okeania sp. SIO1H2]RQH04081.1 bifunctional pantoate--beta-alanine ligase/(d)CMP ki
MRLFTTTAALQCYLNFLKNDLQKSPHTVGLVPTMGALHKGHLSLIKRAREENKITVVTIFVNPLQFSPSEDFQQYPRQLEADKKLCEQEGVDIIFAPTPETMNMENELSTNAQNSTTTVVPPSSMTSIMCSLSRPAFFQGIATIVTKLLSLVQPNNAYFGQKDAQQLAIIQRLVKDLSLSVNIISCPIVRESSGLAISSRNQYLTIEQKQQASILYSSLCHGRKVFLENLNAANIVEKIKNAVQEQLATLPFIKLEYVEIVNPESLQPLENIQDIGLLAIAAHIGSCRLIDNILLRNRKPIIAIDGPAGAGKSTVTKLVAQKLGLLYLDTGAMYRAVTWMVLQAGIPVEDEPQIAELVSQCQISFNGPENNHVIINGQDVTEAIRSREVTNHVSAIAAQATVRYFMVEQQQKFGTKGGIVAEGRDIGTHVFPNAELKIFLTASAEERSRRRLLELQQKGQTNISLEQVKKDIIQRDQKDANRKISPLRKALDAIEISTDGLSIAEVTQKIVDIYRQKNPQL